MKLLLSQLTAVCPLLENNQIWNYCWWLDVSASCDFKVTFIVLALLPCTLRRNWMITFKVRRFLSGFLLHYPLFFFFFHLTLETSYYWFSCIQVGQIQVLPYETLYKELHLLLPANQLYQECGCIYSFLCSPLQACGGFASCCSFILCPSKITDQNPSIFSERNKTNISHMMWQKPLATEAAEAADLFCSNAAFLLPVHQSNLSLWAVHLLLGWGAVQFTLVAFQRKNPSLENVLGSFRGEARVFRSPGSHSEDSLRIKSMLQMLHLLPMHKNGQSVAASFSGSPWPSSWQKRISWAHSIPSDWGTEPL